MNRHLVAFGRVPVDSLFSRNGNLCKKTSTRTARILDVQGRPVFYYGKNEMVEVCDDVRNNIIEKEAQQ